MKVIKLITKIINKDIFKNFVIFGFTDVLNKLIPFLLLPVLTRFLTTDDYGIIASFNSLDAILIILIGLSVNGAVVVNYYKLSPDELRIYVGNTIYLLLISSLIVIGLVLIFGDYFEVLIKLPKKWIYLSICIAFCYFISQINLSLFMVEQKAVSFGIYNILNTILKIGISVFLVVQMGMNWEGNAYGILIGSIIMAVVSLITIVKRNYIKLSFCKKYFVDALNFGIPLIPHQIGYWFRKGGIIFLLVYIVGKSEAGLFDVANKFVLIISLAVASFYKVYQPYLYKILSSNPNSEAKLKLVKYSYLFMISMLMMAILLTIISPWLIDLMTNESFHQSYIFIWNLSLAASFQGMNLVIVGYIFYEKKTKFLALNTLLFAIVQIILTYLLVPLRGTIGAAEAATISFFLSFLSTWIYSNKIYRMPWLLKRK